MFFKRYQQKIILIGGLILITAIATIIYLNHRDDTPNREEYILGKLRSCYEQQNLNFCFKKASEDILGKFSLKEVFTVLGAHTDDKVIFGSCHETLHHLGYQEYQNKKDIKTVLSECFHLCDNGCKNSCINGCYHGAFDAYFEAKKINGENLSDTQMVSEITGMCKITGETTPPHEYSECVHGGGHGLMYLTESDMPKALDVCSMLATKDEKESCNSGVFMENAMSNEIHPSRYFSKYDPLYTCTSLPEKYQPLCYFHASINFLPFTKVKLTETDWLQAFNGCTKVPAKYQKGCMATIGVFQNGLVLKNSDKKEICNLAPSQEFKDDCLNGMQHGTAEQDAL